MAKVFLLKLHIHQRSPGGAVPQSYSGTQANSLPPPCNGTSRTQIFPLGPPRRGREAGELRIGFSMPESGSDPCTSLIFGLNYLCGHTCLHGRLEDIEQHMKYWVSITGSATQTVQPSRRVDHLLQSPSESDRTGFRSQFYLIINTCITRR